METQSVGNTLNPFGSDKEENSEREEEEGGEEERGEGVGGSKEDAASLENLPVDHRPPAAQVEHHWAALGKIISDTGQLTDPFLLEEFQDHLYSIERLVSKERPEASGHTGSCLEVALSQNIVESVYVFGARQRVYGRDIRIMLLKFFTEVFARSQQPVLIHQQFLRPLNRLLRACEGSEDWGIFAALVPLLHQICILIQENQSLLDLFYVEAKAHHPSRFILLTQLIPHMHDTTEIGNRSRDALLLCLSLADQLPHTNLSQFIATDCNFCQVYTLCTHTTLQIVLCDRPLGEALCS